MAWMYHGISTFGDLTAIIIILRHQYKEGKRIMNDIKLDNNGDFDLDRGDFLLIDNDQRIIQQIKIRLLTWSNEWFLNKDVGINYLDIFNEKQNTEALIENLIRNTISDIENVVSVDSVSVKKDNKNRTLTVNFDVTIGFKQYSEVIVLSLR